MKEIQRLIMNVLSSYYNFSIIEYQNNDSNIWGLHKTESYLNEIILFVNKWNLENGYESIENYISSNYGNVNSKIHIIVIDNYNNLSQLIKTLEHPYYINNISFDLILLDEESGKIIYHDETAYNTALLVHKIVSSSEIIKEEKLKKEKITVTNVLLVINILVFLLTAYLSNNIFNINGRVLLILGAKQNDLINIGQYYRFLTAMFLHEGLMHIAFNMYALKALGPFIEGIYGKSKFIIIYFMGGLTSSFFSYLFSNGMSVGASGAIFALLGAALIYGIRKRNEIGRNFLNSIIQVITINLILGFTVSNIDNYGHIGGLIGGIIISLILHI